MNRTKKTTQSSTLSPRNPSERPLVIARRNPMGRASLTLAIAAATLTFSAGCRSGSRFNLFAKKGPSPEALAGSGPTTTYPAPPSTSATPQAIASIAGGTSAPPGDLATPSVSYAAAAANGIPENRTVGFRSGIENLKPPESKAEMANKTAASGSSSRNTPNYASSGYSAPASTSSPGGSGSRPSSIDPPSGYAVGSSSVGSSSKDATSFASAAPNVMPKPAPAKSQDKMASTKPAGMSLPSSMMADAMAKDTSANTPAKSGFTMPDDLMDAIGAGTKTAAAAVADTATSAIGSLPPAASKPAAQTASLPSGLGTPIAPVGYTPGSIRAVNDGYPGAVAPSSKSGGSFYR